jgi:hypothetical protein
MALQLREDKRFHRREQRVQLVGTALVLAILIAAVLGLAGGPGPLSTATAGGGDPVSVNYERFVHSEADDSLSVTIDGAAVTGIEVDLELSAAWVGEVDISGMAPEPAEQIHAGEALVLRLPAEPGATVTIRIDFRTVSFGRLDGWVRVAGTRVPFRQFVYP